MKSFKFLLAGAFLCLCMTTNGFAGITIIDSSGNSIFDDEGDPIDVGSIDTFIEAISKSDLADQFGDGDNGNDPVTETAWVNSILIPDVEFTVKTETLPIFSTKVDNEVSDTVYAVNISIPSSVPSNPLEEIDYFLIKNSTYLALYENNINMNWGVFDTEALPIGMNILGDDFIVSHVTRFDAPDGDITGGGGAVPEPTTMMLLGFGLLGIAGVSRKKVPRK